MDSTTSPPHRQTILHSPAARAGVVLAIALLLIGLFWDSFKEMARLWEEPEYSHGYLIPFLAIYLFLIRAEPIERLPAGTTWAGVVLLLAGMGVVLIGNLSALYVIIQYGFLITMVALVLTLLGFRGVRLAWASLAMLVFMIPLPVFLQYKLSSGLQLLSTDISAWVLRSIGVPVFVEGNVIDLGVQKLQVVEACSGLRYLFPLMTFGLLCGYIYRGPNWHRWLIVLSTIPVTIIMNSIRIAVTGVLYNAYGIGAGDSFLHYFEGWVIFIGCLLILFGEMILLAKLGGRRLDQVFDPQIPSMEIIRKLPKAIRITPPVLAIIPVLAVTWAATLVLAGRHEIEPERQSLYTFPLQLGDWEGTEASISQPELEVLKLTDYVQANYSSPEHGLVNFYVAYYASQRKGASVHSPSSCLPGGGWKIVKSNVVQIPGILPDGKPLPVNQLIISTGSARQLVNYWFMQRGRNLTNEYLVKWYIFWDSLTRERTDGSLVRVLTPLPEHGGEAEAAKRLEAFMQAAVPRLYYYIPQGNLPDATATPAKGPEAYLR